MTAEMKNKYDEYLTNHIDNVKKGFDWISLNLPELIKPEFSDELTENIYVHDRSKYSDEEYIPYAEYFYGRESEKVNKEFNYAWLHHIHNNKHHWQYWMLQHDDEGLELLEIPEVYIIEMICDWWAFSWKADNLYEIFNWYKKHKTGIKMNNNSKNRVEEILNKIHKKLDEELDD